MRKYKGLALIWLGFWLAGILPCSAAETWRLTAAQDWENVSDSQEGQFRLAISQIRQQIDAGKSRQAIRAMEQLKVDYPQFAGPDLDAYIEAEKTFAKAKLAKAAKLYTECMDTYPDSPIYPAAAERLYSIGAAFSGGQKRVFIRILRFPAYDQGESILRGLADREGDSTLAHRSLVALAEGQERRKLYLDAYQTWAEIADRWPTGEYGREALLRMAQSLHAAYTSPHYDATVLRGAASYYEDYRQRYEQNAQELGIAEILEMITEQEGYKRFFTGLYYERVEKLEAACMYYRIVLEDWPQTQAAQMAAEHLSALEQGGSALPPARPRRKVFNASTRFLDNWFGLAHVIDLPTGEVPSPEETEMETENPEEKGDS